VRFRFTMYSVPGGNKSDATFDGDDDLKEVELLRRQASFSYKDGDAFVFMDDEDFTPYPLDPAMLGDGAGYITEGLGGCYVQLIDDVPVALQLPQTVTLEVVETPPELKGGTATKRPKPARLSTGIEIQVPEYIGNGERVLVNTTSGEFSGRAD
jgi:elongation factor P